MTTMRGITAAALLLLSSVCAHPLNNKARNDFIQAMDKATHQKKSLKELQRRLMSNARRLDEAAEEEDDGVDVGQFSLKYIGCESIKTWSDNMAQDEDSSTVFSLKRFVVFRLCNDCTAEMEYGCQYNYGEYMLVMEDYLQIMAEYHYNSFVEYCETCAECMNNNGRRQLDEAAGDDAVDDAGDDAGDDANDGGCQYENECYDYENVCADYNGGDEDVAIEDYFECAEVQIGNAVKYVGPHCNSDEYTLSLGIYNDEYCSEYVGDISEMQYLNIEEDALSFYTPTSCIACNQGEFDLDQNDDGNGVYELCEALYDASAKCNRYMYQDEYESDNQEETEDEVCEFIESLMTNSYDENGEIAIQSDTFDPSNWKDYHEYSKVVYPYQAVLLVFSILAIIGLSIYSCYLHYRITKGATPWKRPTNESSATLAGRISRINSGIMMDRSTSGTMA